MSKQFLINHEALPYLSFRDKLSSIFKPSASKESFWALKNISFSVNEGEAYGIIGKNGAGKSTLLKILSRITPPSSGRIISRGRVASLLEVGTGFHQELSGRENIFMNGSILGMKKKEIEKRFDEIVDFSGVEKFIDTPLKHYSSGMQLRLAFAVAAHLEPEILIIDEVLAVGDADFQKKCVAKMEQVTGQGRTILFVSHNLNVVSSLTSNCILLSEGTIVKNDTTPSVIQEYLKKLSSNSYSYLNEKNESVVPFLSKATVYTSHPNNIQKQLSTLAFEFEITCPQLMDGLFFSFQIFDENSNSVTHIWVSENDLPKLRDSQKIKLRCEIPRCRLYMGRYTLTTNISQYTTKSHYETVSGICPFEVIIMDLFREYEFGYTSKYFEEADWQIE